MATVICLNGIHTSGKTSVGEALKRMGYCFYDEIATKLIREGHAPNLGSGLLPGDAFQRKVMELEIRRDAELKGKNAVVETYHPGNIAHCRLLARDETTQKYSAYFKKMLDSFDVQAVYLRIPTELVVDRSKIFKSFTANVSSFFSRLENEMFEVYRQYGIKYTVVTNDCPIQDTMLRVKEVIDKTWQS